MGSDAAAANGSIPVVSKDLGGKRKKANRSAKLKQCKLDARREQWLSQVKNRSCRVMNAHASPLPLSLPRLEEKDLSQVKNRSCRASPSPLSVPQLEKKALSDSNLKSMEEESNCSETENYSSQNDCSSNRTDSTEKSKEPSSESHHQDNDDDDHGDEDGTLDDWEAVADTLVAGDRVSSDCIPVPNPSDSCVKPNSERIMKNQEFERIPRAWRFDDIFRPRSLPISTTWTSSWANRRVASEPSSCPICYEDFDPTDSSFHPCCCGFRLCLFCHKRILEADGRCPGCRKVYGSNGDGDIGISGGVSLLT